MAKSKTDAQMIARLKRETPEVLEVEVECDALVMRVISSGLVGTSSVTERRLRSTTNSDSRSKPHSHKRKHPNR